MDELKEACQDYFHYIASDDYIDGGNTGSMLKNRIFEAAMKACLGEDILETTTAILKMQDEKV